MITQHKTTRMHVWMKCLWTVIAMFRFVENEFISTPTQLYCYCSLASYRFKLIIEAYLLQININEVLLYDAYLIWWSGYIFFFCCHLARSLELGHLKHNIQYTSLRIEWTSRIEFNVCSAFFVSFKFPLHLLLLMRWISSLNCFFIHVDGIKWYGFQFRSFFFCCIACESNLQDEL